MTFLKTPIPSALLCLLFLPAVAAARLGDTEQEAIIRYGNPARHEQVSGFDKKITFDSFPYTVSVLLKGGRVVIISYQQLDKQKISLSRLERLLQFNGQRENEPEGVDLKNIWFLDGGAPGWVKLRDKSGKTEATYDQPTNTLTVRSLAGGTSATLEPAPTNKPVAATSVKPAPAKAPAKPKSPVASPVSKPASPANKAR